MIQAKEDMTFQEGLILAIIVILISAFFYFFIHSDASSINPGFPGYYSSDNGRLPY